MNHQLRLNHLVRQMRVQILLLLQPCLIYYYCFYPITPLPEGYDPSRPRCITGPCRKSYLCLPSISPTARSRVPRKKVVRIPMMCGRPCKYPVVMDIPMCHGHTYTPRTYLQVTELSAAPNHQPETRPPPRQEAAAHHKIRLERMRGPTYRIGDQKTISGSRHNRGGGIRGHGTILLLSRLLPDRFESDSNGSDTFPQSFWTIYCDVNFSLTFMYTRGGGGTLTCDPYDPARFGRLVMARYGPHE